VITGYNTDITYHGVVYHVQTEDKGLDTPLILSLVYTKGEILASKRTPYTDLIESGFDETILAERLNRQHKLICAAIKQGRIDDLKRMSSKERSRSVTPPVVTVPPTKPTPLTVPTTPTVHTPPVLNQSKPPVETVIQPIRPPATEQSIVEAEEPFIEIPIEVLEEVEAEIIAEEVIEAVEVIPHKPLIKPKPPIAPPSRVLRKEIIEVVADFARSDDIPLNALNVALLEEQEFRGGDKKTISIRVTRGEDRQNIVVGAAVMVKILGSAFRPVIVHSRTGENGIANIQLHLPSFKTGRAALLIRVTHGDYEAELRRIVNQG
jgi:hypothetical protein